MQRLDCHRWLRLQVRTQVLDNGSVHRGRDEEEEVEVGAMRVCGIFEV